MQIIAHAAPSEQSNLNLPNQVPFEWNHRQPQIGFHLLRPQIEVQLESYGTVSTGTKSNTHRTYGVIMKKTTKRWVEYLQKVSANGNCSGPIRVLRLQELLDAAYTENSCCCL